MLPKPARHADARMRKAMMVVTPTKGMLPEERKCGYRSSRLV
jgi:hypothetical protein